MMRRVFVIGALFSFFFSVVSISPTYAATEVAIGSNADVCNQNVTSTTGVIAERSGQDCIITFTNSTEIIWTVPTGINQVSAIVVGGGGAGGDSTANQTGGGGGAGGYFANSNIAISGNVAIKVGSGGTAYGLTSQGASGGNSYLGTLKVGGGGGGNGASYAGGIKAGSGLGGADFVSSGNGGGGRSRYGGTGNETQGGSAGGFSAIGIDFQGSTYVGMQGVAGGNAYTGDTGTGGLGGQLATTSDRTSSISGASVIYCKSSLFTAWTGGNQTPGSGGSPNYGYGTDSYSTGGAGADGIVIIRYTIISTLTNPTYSGEIIKGMSESMTVTSNIPGKVRFYIAGKRIPTCQSVQTTNTWPNYNATCNWKPAISGPQSIYAILFPSDGTSSSVTSGKTIIPIQKRVNNR